LGTNIVEEFFTQVSSKVMKIFKDRVDAGKKLAENLKKYKGLHPQVFALPRGGVIVAYEVAKALKTDLNLIITRKLGHPNNPEYAIGAISENGLVILGHEASHYTEWIKIESAKQVQEAARRRRLYSSGKKPVLNSKTAIIVDDGIATGFTIKAAIKELREIYKINNIVVAVPVAPEGIVKEIATEAVEVVSIIKDTDFLGSVGSYYDNFSPVTDKQVIQIMEKSRSV
jgi:putative phosphoribosyl transferase